MICCNVGQGGYRDGIGGDWNGGMGSRSSYDSKRSTNGDQRGRDLHCVDMKCRMRWCGAGGCRCHTGSEWRMMMMMMIEMAYRQKGE